MFTQSIDYKYPITNRPCSILVTEVTNSAVPIGKLLPGAKIQF